jgi:2-polyprenyl-3-methyl-5-hydroxy-6-metoxy-1,4-benzoquinol methylase
LGRSSAGMISTSSVDAFLAALHEQAPAYAVHVLETARQQADLFNELATEQLSWARAVLGERWLEVLIDGYVFFVTEVNEAQMRYEEDGRYAHALLKDIQSATYDDHSFMQQYEWGVFVTAFAWQHHLELYRFYRDDFLSRLPETGTLLDLGCGVGGWHLLALRRNPAVQVHAIDISAPTLATARQLAASLGLEGRVRYTQQDASGWEPGPLAQAGICCFVLEHVEQPAALLTRFIEALEPHAYAFVCTALTAAEVDHLHEFRYESEVVQLCEQAGARVVACRSLAPPGVPPSRRFLPRSMALLLQKRKGELW